jgi:hypothetical protein
MVMVVVLFKSATRGGVPAWKPQDANSGVDREHSNLTDRLQYLSVNNP